MSGEERFTISIYADGCMLVEVSIGRRQTSCAACWEWCCQQIIGDDSANADKKKIEGAWSRNIPC